MPMSNDWCGLGWTQWAPLQRQAILQFAPTLPGVYRIRHQGGELNRLVYVGQTGRSLRERLMSLARGANADECPYNDPHTAAPHLWLLQRLDGARFEFSCAAVGGNVQLLRGTEDMLLWQHRVQSGSSTIANYGRFYPGYARATNRWIVRRNGGRAPGQRAAPFTDGLARDDFSGSHPVLQCEASVLQAFWWQRIPLSEALSLPVEPAVYCLYDHGAEEPIYIGETSILRARAVTHATTPWGVKEPWLAYMLLPAGTPKHVLRELESDLLGQHFWHSRRPPSAQYKGTNPNTGEGSKQPG
jgi:hypothetical protein